MSDGDWLVKQHHGPNYDHESVIARYPTKAVAENRAEIFNSVYQTDEYYVEAWDAEKVKGWPTNA